MSPESVPQTTMSGSSLVPQITMSPLLADHVVAAQLDPPHCAPQTTFCESPPPQVTFAQLGSPHVERQSIQVPPPSSQLPPLQIVPHTTPAPSGVVAAPHGVVAAHAFTDGSRRPP